MGYRYELSYARGYVGAGLENIAQSLSAALDVLAEGDVYLATGCVRAAMSQAARCLYVMDNGSASGDPDGNGLHHALPSAESEPTLTFPEITL